MSDTSGYRPRQNRRVSRRVFLHSTSVIPVALAAPALLRPPTAMTTRAPISRQGQRILRIAPADCRRRAVATVGRTGHTVDRRSRVPGRAASSGPPARARGGVQNDQRGVGGDVDPTRARLPLPRGGRDQPTNARESRTRTCETGARRARLASVPREGPQPGRHDGRPPRDQQPGAAARRRDARRTPTSLARSPDVRQPAAHEDAERTRHSSTASCSCTAAIPASARRR